MTVVVTQAVGCQTSHVVEVRGERSPPACWYCAGIPASSSAKQEEMHWKSVKTNVNEKGDKYWEVHSVRKRERESTWTKVGGSSNDIWAVGMSSLSQGGFFLCRLLVLSRRVSAMFSVPPQACQLHTWRRIDKIIQTSIILIKLNLILRNIVKSQFEFKHILFPQ